MTDRSLACRKTKNCGTDDMNAMTQTMARHTRVLYSDDCNEHLFDQTFPTGRLTPFACTLFRLSMQMSRSNAMSS